MQKIKLSGILFIAFLALSLSMALFYLPTAWNNVENPTRETIMVGTWTPEFEKSLNESLPVFEPSRNLWGQIQYALFGQGRRGVIVGDDGWLFTDEEFSCLRGAEAHWAENMDYVKSVKETIESKGVSLYVVLVPAKARVYQDYLGKNRMTSCRESVYSNTLGFMQKNGIMVTGLLEGMKEHKNRDALFLRSDTHWTPEGAEYAAELVSEGFDKSKGLTEKIYETELKDMTEHEGDLLRYLPGVRNNEIKSDEISVYVTEEKIEDAEGDQDSLGLFGDDVPPVTLVGTSYSANPKWHFVDFLKDKLQIDIFNAADEGLGPFAVMKTYLGGKAWENSAPSVVIWEIPERYVVVDQSNSAK